MDGEWTAHWRGRERCVLFAAGHDESQLDFWRNDPQRPRHLHIITCAAGTLPGFERRIDNNPGVTLDLLHADPLHALAQLRARIDAVWLPASCKVDPERFARALARLLARDAVLHADAIDPNLKTALEASGWQFHSPSQARFVTRKPIAPMPPPPIRRAIVIGAGLAGAAACQRLCARGWHVTLLERHPAAAMEASGNLAGISMPLLSKDDNQASRLARAAYTYARAYWHSLGGVGRAIEGDNCGVVLAARDVKHAVLQAAIAAAQPLRPDYAQWFDARAAAARWPGVAPFGAWWFAGGSWIRPGSAIAAMLAACGDNLTARFGTGDVQLRRSETGWEAVDASGAVLAAAPTVIVASGGAAFAQTAALPLQRVRGQVTHLAQASEPGLQRDYVLCREAYLTPAAGGTHSMGATYDDDDDPALRPSSQHENLAHLRAMLADPAAALDAPLAGRVGFRAVATDRLPMVGAVPDATFEVGAERLRELPRQEGVYCLLGYASRGLIWAPLAAELLAASLEGEPLPLEGVLIDALDPGRFLLRERRTKRQPLR